VRKSSIRKQSRAGLGSPLAVAIGVELRRRRLAKGLTQQAVGAPLSRAFVCAVERGHAVPSIPALAMLADGLDVSLDEFFRGVNAHMTSVYSQPHGSGEDPASRRRR
jgi:transcriptional regulator with XRE-family HTH domain